MSNDIVEITNEYRRINRQIESKTAQLAALLAANGEAGDFPTDFLGVRPRRYSIEFSFKPNNAVLPPSQEKGVTIEAGTIFRAAAIESFVAAIGTANDPYTAAAVSVQATLPWEQRLLMFDYFWRMRDTGTDREWTDQPQPAIFGGGDYMGPLWFPRRNILGGGTTVLATINPFIALTSVGSSFFGAAGTVEEYSVNISIIGHEVPDGSAL